MQQHCACITGRLSMKHVLHVLCDGQKINICHEVWVICINTHAHTLVWYFFKGFCDFYLCLLCGLDSSLHFSSVVQNNPKLLSQGDSLWVLKQTPCPCVIQSLSFPSIFSAVLSYVFLCLFTILFQLLDSLYFTLLCGVKSGKCNVSGKCSFYVFACKYHVPLLQLELSWDLLDNIY